ncbi:MAG: hypothetical protein NVSMB4_02840 [Acidimicrobiales bacterium]
MVAIGVAGLLCMSSGAGRAAESGAATFRPQAVAVKRLTRAVHMTKDNPAPARAFAGPTDMLVDPTNPRVIVAETADLRTRVCSLLRSTDAGRTWHIAGPNGPALPSFPYCVTAANAGATQASIAWGSHHTLYYALAGYGPNEGAGNGHTSVLLARSTDLGDTWSTVVVDNNRDKGGDAPPRDSGVTGLAVDTSGPRDVVYVGFMQTFPKAPKDSLLQDGAVLVAVSSDGGRSFTPPVNLNTFSHLTQTIKGQDVPLFMQSFFGAPYLVAHGGVVEAIGASQSTFSAKISGTGATALPLLAARSTDQGRTWSFTTLTQPIFSGTGAQTGVGWTPHGGPHGTFLAAYASTPATAGSSGTAGISLQRSTDEGRTWSDPVTLNDDDPAQQFTSFYPQMGVAPDGRVDVVWEDNRDQHDYHFQVRYSYSTDGGVSWSKNMQVTDQPVNFGLGVSFNSDIRQPPGVASANQYAAFGWSDTRLGNPDTQTQDDFGALAQFATLPATGSKILPILAAIFGGLALAGLVLLLALAARRRRWVDHLGGAQPA